LFTAQVLLAFGQSEKTGDKLSNLTKLDIGLQGAGFTFEPKISNKTTMDISAGIGGGYDIEESDFAYSYSNPAFYFSVTPKYFYNLRRRAENGKITRFNSANYIGLRLKYVTQSFVSDDGFKDAFLINLHWGIQRAISNRWTLNTHIGIGYAKNFDSPSGSLYPAFDFKFSYIFLKHKM